MRHRRAPRTTPAVLPATGPLPAIALLIVTSCVDVAWGNSEAVFTTPPETRKQRLDRTVLSLTTGTLAERLEAAEDIDDLFDFDPDQGKEPDDEDFDGEESSDGDVTPADVAKALFEAIEAQPEDFVGWTMVDSLSVNDDRGISELISAALKSSSLNVRAAAVQWFTFSDAAVPESIPDLEDLWDGGLPEWARADLMTALAKQGSARFLPDFVKRTRDADPSVRFAAIEALGTLHLNAILPILIQIARQGDSFEREFALEAIATWSESDDAFATILEASRSRDPLQGNALRLLATMRRVEGDERLIEALAEPLDPHVRMEAARALEDSEHPGTTGALVQLLGDPEIQQRASSELLGILHNRDDHSALPGLIALLEGGYAQALDRFENLIAYLGRPAGEKRSTMVTLSCGMSVLDADDPRAWHVVAPNGWASIRCSQMPGRPGESWQEERVPDGSWAYIEARFDRSGETWAYLDGSSFSDCWAPMRFLEPGIGPGQISLDPSALEIDLPSHVVETRALRSLIKEGAIQLFDIDDGVVGAALHPRDEGPTIGEIADALEKAGGEDLLEPLESLLEQVEVDLMDAAEASEGSGKED